MKNSPLQIGGHTIQPGEKITLALPTPELYTCTPIYIPVHVIHGKRAGPRLLICAGMHGDEINGVAITQKLLNLQTLKSLRGTLIVIPALNIYGMMTQSRNLPDRRDLEGSFPGSEKGSYAARLADLLNKEIFSLATHCIDLHTGEPNIQKFPHIRTQVNCPEALTLAHYFNPPIIKDCSSDEGLLWLMNKTENSIPTILFETGEALRLDNQGIKIGTQGIVRVLKALNMIKSKGTLSHSKSYLCIGKDQWVRAPSSGLCETYFKVGDIVEKGNLVAKIYDPFGSQQKESVFAPFDGFITSRNQLPILNEGEPVIEISTVEKNPAPLEATTSENHPAPEEIT